MRTSVGLRLRAFMTDDDVAIVRDQSQIARSGEDLSRTGPSRSFCAAQS
jgi:hypothetical protein